MRRNTGRNSTSKPDEKDEPRCGICGSTSKRLIRTECCGNLICDDEDEYIPFSYARNSCSRNHRRLTLCGSHFEEGHGGDWKDCEKCRKGVETEMYVWYGTNEYNFEKLPNPPDFEPTLCRECGRRIRLGEDGYSVGSQGYLCEECTGNHTVSPGPGQKSASPAVSNTTARRRSDTGRKKLHPSQFRVNEAWIAFQLNDHPIETIRDGSFNCVCLMDAASCYILGQIMVPSDRSEPSLREARRLLKTCRNKAGLYPDRLIVPAGRYAADLAAEAGRQGIVLDPEPASRLQPFTAEARQSFREFLSGRPR